MAKKHTKKKAEELSFIHLIVLCCKLL